MNIEEKLARVKKRFPSISDSLIIFCMGLLTGYGDRLLPPKVMDFLDSNRVAQLIMTYMLILFSVDIFGDSVSNVGNGFIYAAIIFIAFTIICKQSNYFFFATIILLGLFFELIINFLTSFGFVSRSEAIKIK